MIFSSFRFTRSKLFFMAIHNYVVQLKNDAWFTEIAGL